MSWLKIYKSLKRGSILILTLFLVNCHSKNETVEVKSKIDLAGFKADITIKSKSILITFEDKVPSEINFYLEGTSLREHLSMICIADDNLKHLKCSTNVDFISYDRDLINSLGIRCFEYKYKLDFGDFELDSLEVELRARNETKKITTYSISE